MTEEEKKAIKIVDDIAFSRGIRQDVDGKLEDLKAIKDVFRLVDNKQKEIEIYIENNAKIKQLKGEKSIMSKANEIFKSLGYEEQIEPVVNGGIYDFGYYHNFIHTFEKTTDENTIEYIKEIIFINRIKNIKESSIMIRSGYKQDFDTNYNYTNTEQLSIEELQAINEKVKELGWDE